jgi:DNA adenine methylase
VRAARGAAALARRQPLAPPLQPQTGGLLPGGGEVLRPPLKWAGGKRWLVPHVAPLWQRFRGRRLVEPFCGGLAVALGLMPARAWLSDINPHVVNFYRWLKRGLKVGLVMRNDTVLFYRHRERFNRLVANGAGDSAEAAALFYYLNRTGYNGLCRFNRKGEFNVPFGRYHRINYVNDFSTYRTAFKHWNFSAVDFEALELEPSDFIYADPPYDVEFTQYSKEGFGWDEQVRLAEFLARHRGPVVLSNQATPRILRLYRKLGFAITCLFGPRMISCTGNRTPAPEVLATKGIGRPCGSEIEAASEDIHTDGVVCRK